MHVRWIMALGFCAAVAAPGRGADKFPYLAEVAAADVYVRSGPGTDYYPTDKLKSGQQLEIWRHEPGGWCAVRPPDGSFSWVAGRHLKSADEGQGEITTDRVAARIGSNLEATRDVISVRLKCGEAVEVLGVERSESQTWYKIAPPSGEFRWVHGKYLARLDGYGRISDATPTDRGTARDGEPQDAQPAKTDGAARRSWSAEPDDVRAKSAAETPATEKSSASRRPISQSLQSAVDELDLELSAMVVKDPAAWRFSELRRKSDGLMERSRTALERGHVRNLLAKIDRFDQLQRGRIAAGPANVASQGATGTPIVAASDEQYDGQGVLVPVYSSRDDGPKFALTDGTRRVLMFVSPAPDVNLRPHVGRYIGVTGIRGYLMDADKPHVVAKRVTVLGDAKRR